MSTSERPAPPQVAGPAEGTRTKANLHPQSSDTTDNPASPHRVVPLPLRWAKNLIDNARGPIPEYGSTEFSALPDGPEKVASALIASEHWRTRHHQPDYIRPRSRRARELAEARRPRPGDHPGGPVAWDEVASGE